MRKSTNANEEKIAPADGVEKTPVDVALGEAGELVAEPLTLGRPDAEDPGEVKFETHRVVGPCGDVPCGGGFGTDAVEK